MPLKRRRPRWPELAALGLVALFPLAVSADTVPLTSSHLTSLTTCGLMSNPGGANLDTDAQVQQYATTSGTSTTVTATTLADTTQAWTVNAYVGANLIRGASTATVTSNSATVLTFTGGWTGGTPSNGAYQVFNHYGGTANGLTWSWGGINVRTYIQFPLSGCLNAVPASATVRSATLRLNAIQLPTASVACRTIDVFAVTSAWSESTILWSNQPFGIANNNPATGSRTTSQLIGQPAGCANHTLGAYVNYDVTSDVAKFVAGTMTNNGWMLRDDTENYGGGDAFGEVFQWADRNYAGLVAQAPTLMISYTP